MARKRQMAENSVENTSESLINRRDYLKGTAAAVAAAGGMVGSASAQSYETIPANGQSISIGAGETWENKLIDFSTGNRITITAHSTDWTIRNIGFEGFNSSPGLYAIFGISDQGNGNSVMENVYMGDGGASGDGGETGNGHGITAVWANPDHNGHIDSRNCNFQGWYDNALYCSAPGNAGGGTFHIDNCYAANCFVSHYRLATQGSQITDSVVYMDNNFYNGRAVWAWNPGPIPVENCTIETNGNHYSFVAGANGNWSSIDVTDTSWDTSFNGGYLEDPGSVRFHSGNDTNPSAYIPDGVPTSAVEAASGQAGDPDPEPASISPPVLDNFERSDPIDEYGGETGLFDVETSTVYAGDQALTNDSGSFGGINSTSGLGNYPSRGDEVHVHFQNASDENFVAFNLFSQSETDNPDRYSVGISGVSGDFVLWRTEDGDVDTLDSDAPSSYTSGWYRAEISTYSSTVSADLYDDSDDTLLASVSASDSTFSSGGIGFRSAGNGEIFDDVVRPPIDDFERSNPLSEYGGETGLFSTTSSPVYEGSQALTNDSGSFGGINSTSGLTNYPTRGDEVHYFVNNAGTDNFVAVNLFSQSAADDPERYSAGISGVSGEWTLWKQEDGTLDTLASEAPSQQISDWYRVEMRTDSSTVYADLYDDSTDDLLASIQASDTTFSSGGIGFRSGGNGEVWDYVVK